MLLLAWSGFTHMMDYSGLVWSAAVSRTHNSFLASSSQSLSQIRTAMTSGEASSSIFTHTSIRDHAWGRALTTRMHLSVIKYWSSPSNRGPKKHTQRVQSVLAGIFAQRMSGERKIVPRYSATGCIAPVVEGKSKKFISHCKEGKN